ncbi:MAG: protein containing heavy-metal-associated domain [Chitinophagaceae bacterium]|nr:protein containing heavy-metal-associated domain [Chitinophagaceae bacterium]
MKTLKFKTNINCSGCIARVTPTLNSLTGTDKWDVNITDLNKILTIQTSQLDVDDVKQALEKAGFKSEEIEHTIQAAHSDKSR